MRRASSSRTLSLAAALVVAASCARIEPPPARADGPHRIVALTVGAVDSLALLGELDRVVGVEADCFVPGTEGLVRIRNDDHAGPSQALNVEAVLALAPDLVIAKEDLRPALEGRGVRVQWVPNRTGLDTIVPFVLELGRELGAPDEAAAVLDDMHARMDAVRARVAGRPPVRVYYEAGSLGRTAGRGTVVDDMIRLAGGVNVAGELPLANPVLTAEAIVAADPEVIVLSPWSDAPEAVAQRPGWDHVRAVRDGRVYRVPERQRKLQYPSPSCVVGCEELLVPWLHPELAPVGAQE
ncbi:MAG: ABC transporter substrate-binding protein [Planctomycetes bacterium]|nr:ABC transporter substrate-binding protein [Planctomycetota bacterium]